MRFKMAARHTILDPDTLPVAGAKWDWVSIALLTALLVFMPASFGAVEAWSELIVIVLAAALSLCLVARLVFDREFALARTWLYVPLGAFVVLIALQAAPLPTHIVASLAPWNVATKAELLGDLSGAVDVSVLSFYPNATAEQLRLALVGVVVFVTVASVFRSVQLIKTILLIVFAIGCAEALLALAQIATRTGDIYWRIPTGHSLVTSGSFINYSNFSQFMNLSISAGIALVLIRMQEHRRENSASTSWTLNARAHWDQHGWLFFGIILSAVAVFASLSKNGAISLVVAAAVLAVALSWRGNFSGRGWTLAVLPFGVLAVLLVFGFDFIYGRFATLHQADIYEYRWEMTAATLRAWQHAPIWGTGLGTHEVVFPMFDTSVTPVVAADADNDYAQLLEETGIVGAAFLGAFMLGVVALIVKVARRGHTDVAPAVYGIAFGLVAVTIHSATDFGQRLPANFCLLATLTGLVVAMGRLEKRHEDLQNDAPRVRPAIPIWIRRAIAAVMFVGVAALWFVTIRGAYATYIGERWYTAALGIEPRLTATNATPSDDDYVDLIAAATAASQSQPNNISYAYWLNYYRWASLSSLVDPTSGELVLRSDSIPTVRRIADELAAARRSCPTFGPAYALEGQLRLFVLNDKAGADLIRKGLQLAPNDPPTCLVAGELAARDGKFSDAIPLLMRAIKLHPDYFGEVARFCLNELKRPDIARTLAGDDYGRLSELARMLPAEGDDAKYAKEFQAQAEEVLRRRVSANEATASQIAALAAIEQSRNQWEAAIQLYNRALVQDYPQVDWRLNLARALAANGKPEDALHEVRICLRLRPRHPEATKLLEELTDQIEAGRAKGGS